jgi:hypothetical protein
MRMTWGLARYVTQLARRTWRLLKNGVGQANFAPDGETAILGLNPAISPAYSGLPVLRWAAVWDGTSL